MILTRSFCLFATLAVPIPRKPNRFLTKLESWDPQNCATQNTGLLGEKFQPLSAMMEPKSQKPPGPSPMHWRGRRTKRRPSDPHPSRTLRPKRSDSLSNIISKRNPQIYCKFWTALLPSSRHLPNMVTKPKNRTWLAENVGNLAKLLKYFDPETMSGSNAGGKIDRKISTSWRSAKKTTIKQKSRKNQEFLCGGE